MSPTGYAAYHRRRAEEDVLLGPMLSETLAELWQQKRAEAEDRSQSFMDWSLKIPEPKTGTLDFKRFPFQVELYKECATYPEVVVTKSTQVGVSAYLVRWTMFAADVLGLTALYVFPKRAQLLDFSDARVRPLILNSEHLRSRVPTAHVSNKSHKQVGLGRVLYRGSQSADDLQSADADVLALDEYDDLVVEHIPDAERRLTGSQVGWVRRVGVPTDPDYGLDKLYSESDRRRWFVRCDACRDRQPITFYDNVDQDALLIICAKCTKPLDVTQGEWVAEFPDRSVRGYHIPRLIVPGTDLGKIVKASKAREPYKVKVFHNKDLGEAWAPEEGRLSKEALAAAERAYTMSPGYVGPELVTMGVDVASARALNVRISLHTEEGTTKGALWIGTVDAFDDLALLMDRYDVKMCAIDHMPEHRLSRAFAERFAGRVYLARYTGTQVQKVFDVDEDMRVVTVRRTEAIDATMQMIREQRNHLPLDRPDDYGAQMMAALRFVDQDEFGRTVVGYRSTAPDDYLHAEVYDVLATELWYFRQHIDEAQREVYSRLEDHMEFRRSGLGDYGDPDKPDVYQAGPSEDYNPGYEPD